MAEKKYLDLLGLQTYDEKIKAHIADADAQVLADSKAYADGLATNYDVAGTAATKVQELADGAVKANADAIAKLNGAADAEGSVAKAVADAKAELNALIESNDADIAGLTGRMDAAEGEIDALQEDVGNVDDLQTTNKDVVSAINEVRNAVAAGGTAAAITLDSNTTTEGALKSYTLKQGDNTIGVIDIPKDMVVESGEVVDVDGVKNIKLVLANVADPLYIPVGSLVDIYTAKAAAAQVQVAIDSATREISAHIVSESVTATELAADSVVTVKIADKNVTKAKLSAEVQASLDKADVAETNAKAYADQLNTAMDTRVSAVETALGTGEGSVEDKISTAKQEAIDAAATDAANKDAVVLASAQEFATNLNTAMDTRMQDVEAKAHEHANKAELDLIATGDKAKWDAMEGNANTYADGLNTAMDARVAALETWHEEFVEVSEDDINALFQ